MTLFDSIKKIFRKETVDIVNSDINGQASGEQVKFIWCLVGNIVEERLFGVDYEIKYGTKHFSSNTKVYCFPSLWGDGYENIKVIGRHRKTSRNICIVMPAKFITNWRLQKVYRPYVMEVMQTQHGWTNSENDKETILEMLKWLPDRTIKIGE